MAISTFGDLKSTVAEVLHGAGKTTIETLAGTGIQSGIDDINMRSDFEFGRSTPAAANMTADQNYIDLTTAGFASHTDIYKNGHISSVQLIDKATSEPYRTLEFREWEAFQQAVQDQDLDGVPYFWTVENLWVDKKVYIYPEPDAAAAADYQVRFTYFKRIAQPSLDADTIEAPRELLDVLIAYGRWWLLFHRKQESVAAWRFAWGQYTDKLTAYKAARGRKPAALNHMVILTDHAVGNGEYDPLS